MRISARASGDVVSSKAIAERRLVGHGEGWLELRRQQRQGLQRRPSIGTLIGIERSHLGEDSRDLGDAEAEQVEKHVALADVRQLTSNPLGARLVEAAQ
jgi:hypothetical protein